MFATSLTGTQKARDHSPGRRNLTIRRIRETRLAFFLLLVKHGFITLVDRAPPFSTKTFLSLAPPIISSTTHALHEHH